ncbi:protein PERCC1 [Struthio camelus]|uniref:protein PERCC1 n=1 Tax=Struthio camelus TaxID=8801 RepID=UPI0036041A5C
MAAGVIRHLAELRLPSPFPHGLLLPAHPEPDFPDLSEEDEEEDEEEEEEAAAEGAGRGEQELTSPSDTETTLRLLKFSELISCDIQRYFGRKGRDEEAEGWGASEDCRSPRRSGRELYYAELLRAARSGEPEDEVARAGGGPRGWRPAGGPQPLGPLAELFEYGLHRCLQPRAADGKKQRLERKYAHITPMHERQLPQSFWREPGPGPALHPSAPDFSDLLANWTAEAAPELPPEPGRPGLEAERSGAL